MEPQFDYFNQLPPEMQYNVLSQYPKTLAQTHRLNTNIYELMNNFRLKEFCHATPNASEKLQYLRSKPEIFGFIIPIENQFQFYILKKQDNKYLFNISVAELIDEETSYNIRRRVEVRDGDAEIIDNVLYMNVGEGDNLQRIPSPLEEIAQDKTVVLDLLSAYNITRKRYNCPPNTAKQVIIDKLAENYKKHYTDDAFSLVSFYSYLIFQHEIFGLSLPEFERQTEINSMRNLINELYQQLMAFFETK